MISLFLLSLFLLGFPLAQAAVTSDDLRIAQQLSLESFSSSACSYNGIDYSGLSAIADLSFTVENPCGLSTGTFDYFMAFCRAVSPSSSKACNAANASICAVQRESGKMIVFSTFPANTRISPVNFNESYGLTLQGEFDDQQGFINVFCPAAEVRGSPRSEYSPWLPSYFTSTFSNSVNSNGECSTVEFGFNLPCACPGSGGCQTPLPAMPVDAAIFDLTLVDTACAGPNGSIFSMAAFNLTLYQSIPDGKGGFSSWPYAKSPLFFTNAVCVWSPYDEALYVGLMAYNSSGSFILRVEENSVEEFVWFSDGADMESLAYYDGSIFANIISNNYTLSNTIYRYPVRGNEKSPARTYHNVNMEGFAGLYINPLTGILYSAYSFGYFGLNLKTEEIINVETVGIDLMNFAFSNAGTIVVQTQQSDLYNDPYPSCQFSSMVPETGKMTLLSTMDDCAMIYTHRFFMDSTNRLWATNWGRLLRLNFHLPEPSMEFLEK